MLNFQQVAHQCFEQIWHTCSNPSIQELHIGLVYCTTYVMEELRAVLQVSDLFVTRFNPKLLHSGKSGRPLESGPFAHFKEA